MWQLAVAQPERVFPGAVGFGVDSPAGRGGQIVRVTNLEARGSGSLRAAIEMRGPRVVVFEVGGIIDLQQERLTVAEPFLTIAGQTAPSPGITLIRGDLYITTHDVLVQHLRVRPGDAGAEPASGWEPDCITVTGKDAYKVVIDHCSVSWGVDENLDASGPLYDGPDATARNVTFSNSLVAEALLESVHSEGKHSKGLLIHDFCTNIAVIGNLFAHNYNRNPLFKGGCTGVVVNNLIYNPADATLSAAYNDDQWRGREADAPISRIAAVGNVMIAGGDTQDNMAFIRGAAHKARYFLHDNHAHWQTGEPIPLSEEPMQLVDEKPVWPTGLTALPASQVVDHIVRQVGARPAARDEVDRRIIRDFLARKGRLINSQDDVGGYPTAQPTRHRLQIPADKFDRWLAEMTAQVMP